MEKLMFRCPVCKQKISMKRHVPSGFMGWAYCNMDWTDLDEHIPALDEYITSRSKEIPKIGQYKTVKVREPFEEAEGDEFYMEFQPESIYNMGYLNVDNLTCFTPKERQAYQEDVDKGAIVKCRLEKVLLNDGCSGWIKVEVLDVIRIAELYKHSPYVIDESLSEFASIGNCDAADRINEHWESRVWSAQGDLGNDKLVYIDDEGIEHLVLMSLWDMHLDVMYFGNIVERILR